MSPLFSGAGSISGAVAGDGVGVGDGAGVVVSTVKVMVLLASDSSWLFFLAASENLSLATCMTPLIVLR